MEQIIYRPYGSYRFLAWVFICLAIILCLLSYYFILPALLLMVPVFFLFRVGKAMIVINESGIRLLNEKASSNQYFPWDQLKYYQLTNNLRGYDVILLSSVPLPPSLAKKYANRGYFFRRLWFDSVLIIPLFSMKNSEIVRKFIYQKVSHK